MWLVDSLDTLVLVCKGSVSVLNVHDDCHSYLSAQIQQLIPVHTLGKMVLSSLLWMMLLALYMNPDWLTASMTAIQLIVPTHKMLECSV